MPPTDELATIRKRRLATWLVVALLAGCVGSALVGCRAEDRPWEDLLYVNKARASRGVAPLVWDAELARKAQSWASTLADRGSLAHSELTDGVSAGWTALGENVGTAGTVFGVHQGFMGSPEHRATLLNRTYRSVGIGVVEQGGSYWVVEVYRA